MADSGSPELADGSALCAGCGLCCDGTLFSQARAEPDERDRMRGHGVEPFDSEGIGRFRLPCPRLEGTACTIYEDRFTICRSFRCALLRRYQAGEIGLEEARRTVRTAKTLLDRVAARERGDIGALARRRLARTRLAEMRSADSGEEAGRAYLDLVALERFLDTRFRNPKPGPAASMEPDIPGRSSS